jgi:hypothetical protein
MYLLCICFLGSIINSEILNLKKNSANNNEKFECIADNGIGDVLRKVVNIYFSGKNDLF